MSAYNTFIANTQEYVPEFRLLLTCARKTLRPVDADRSTRLFQEQIDW